MQETSSDEIKRLALALHDSAPLVDLHADTLSMVANPEGFIYGKPKPHLDLPMMIEAGIWAEVFSIFVYHDVKHESASLIKATSILKNILRTIELSNGKLALALTPNDVFENRKKGIRSALIEIEGLHSLDTDISLIEDFFRKGVRVFTLTWNNSNRWATSCMDKNAKECGITEDGWVAVLEIERLGGIIDLSHSGEKTFWDIIESGKNPPICSHSCCRAIKESTRNLTDDQIKALIAKGGVLGVNFFPGFLSSKSYSKTSSDDIVAHILHILELGGESSVGLGSDFDGIQHLPGGMEDCRGMIQITEKLLQREISQNVIEKILGRNFLDLFGKIHPAKI